MWSAGRGIVLDTRAIKAGNRSVVDRTVTEKQLTIVGPIGPFSHPPLG